VIQTAIRSDSHSGILMRSGLTMEIQMDSPKPTHSVIPMRSVIEMVTLTVTPMRFHLGSHLRLEKATGFPKDFQKATRMGTHSRLVKVMDSHLAIQKPIQMDFLTPKGSNSGIRSDSRLDSQKVIRMPMDLNSGIRMDSRLDFQTGIQMHLEINSGFRMDSQMDFRLVIPMHSQSPQLA